MEILIKNESLVTDPLDLKEYRDKKAVFNWSKTAFYLSLPMSFYLTRQMTKQPQIARKLIVGNLLMCTCVFMGLGYSLSQVAKQEMEISKKYMH